MRLTRTFAAMLMALVFGTAQRALADGTPPDYTIDLDPGIGCPVFALRIEIWANPNRVYREFVGKDTNGEPVRYLDAGKGSTLVFTNLANSREYWVRPNGSVDHITVNADGTRTWVTSGHYVIVFFPDDSLLPNGEPAGPSTRQYVGQVVWIENVDSSWTVLKVKGTFNDICAAIQ